MNIKKILKENIVLRRIVKAYKNKKEFIIDSIDFNKYYNDSRNQNNNTIEYKILLLVHSLEKGMCYVNPRPFGEKKIIDLVYYLNWYMSNNENLNNTSFFMGCEIIKKWLKIYDENNFSKDYAYNSANKFIESCRTIENINVGSFDYIISNNDEQFNLDYIDFLKTRHSVREFLMEPLLKNDIEYCVKCALQTPTACNRQMIKIYSINDENKKNLLNNIIMGLSGFDKKSINYFVVTFDISALSFYGERNQGYFNAGLVAMNFVNAMHSKKIGSCFLQWGNTNKEEKKIKRELNIPMNEKIAVVIAAGYYKNKAIVPLSQRKNITEIYKII